MKPHPRQLTFPLTHIVTTERAISRVCIPDRFAAENEVTQLQAEHGSNLLKTVIRKDRPSRREGRVWAAPGTYTLRYFIRESREERLF